MNKVLIGFVGLYRNFKETSTNILLNLIQPNMEKYLFSIIINTDFSCITTNKRKNISESIYSNLEDLEKDLYNSYNKYNQIKYIMIDNCNFREIPADPFLFRINKIIEKEKNEDYDFYIFIRMDVEINKNINLDNYNNKFSIITPNVQRECIFHNRDWDFMWISDKKSFFSWIYYYSIFYKKYYNNNSMVSYNLNNTLIIDDLSMENIELIYKYSKLKGSYCKELFIAVYCLYLNNCIFELSENIDLYSKLIN